MEIKHYKSILIALLFIVFNFKDSLQVSCFKSAKLLRADLAKGKFVQLPVYVYL